MIRYGVHILDFIPFLVCYSYIEIKKIKAVQNQYFEKFIGEYWHSLFYPPTLAI